MKTLALSLALILGAIFTSFAQCEKGFVFQGSKTAHLENGTVSRIEEEKTILTINKTSLVLNVNGEEHGSFPIVSNTCDWKVPFKEGKSVIVAMINDAKMTITFEGKEGKVTVFAKRDENTDQDNVLITADKFEEIK